jgi:GDP-D-mannose dehydratase
MADLAAQSVANLRRVARIASSAQQGCLDAQRAPWSSANDRVANLRKLASHGRKDDLVIALSHQQFSPYVNHFFS